jgi:ketosteroid isomerase-like protein
MKRLYFILYFTAVLTKSLSQELPNRDLQNMVETERAFVRAAKERNIRDAFLTYLSEDAVISGPTGPVKGLAGFKNRPADTVSWLFWEVAYCDIAAAGDLGYDSGPYEFRSSKHDDYKALAWGQFNSVWKKQNDGTWKNVADIGIRHDGPYKAPILETGFVQGRKYDAKSRSISSDEIKSMDVALSKKLMADGNLGYKGSLSPNARVCRPGYLPMTSSKELDAFFSQTQTTSNIEFVGADISKSDDLAYTYGSADVEKSDNGKTTTAKATYLRVWKKESGKWKVVLDVLSY